MPDHQDPARISMRALHVHDRQSPKALYEDMPVPRPGIGDVVLAVGAASFTPAGFDLRTDDFADADDLTASHVRNADILVDTVGGDLAAQCTKMLRSGGAVVSVVVDPAHPRPDGGPAVFFVIEPSAGTLIYGDSGSEEPVSARRPAPERECGQAEERHSMPTRTEHKAIVSRCLAAWSSGDLDTTRSLLHDDVVFAGPLGATEGADAYIAGIQAMVKIVERADQREVFGEGEDVCIIYDLVTRTPAARIPAAGWYRVRDGKIASVRAFFDPRPLTSAS